MILNNNNTKISKREPVAHNVEVLLEQHQNKSFKCFYCTKSHSTDIERITHIACEHPGKIYYPTPEDFENRLEK